MNKHAILLTPGEPAGVGPELVVRASQQVHPYPLVAICDPYLLEIAADSIGLNVKLNVVDSTDSPLVCETAGEINVMPVALKTIPVAGKLDLRNAEYVLKTLQTANDLCLHGHAAAVVTGPVQKSVINDAGFAFSGHTEFFAEHSDTKKVVMMLATSGLRVALATTHIPLKDVATAITRESLQQVIGILVDELRGKFKIAKPKILVAGLNPHAGEGGHLGREEIDTIVPVLKGFDTTTCELLGPLPADTLFTAKYLEHADCVLAMYHDQGLPVLKHKGFGKAVNITLGLPYIRTSVDHGTALDLAGSGRADPSSMLEAIAIASELVQNRAH